MGDSEKLTALKKAYAEIILNTAKEAAARIIVSERKALRYQQELITAKDEALRMLLRLKQMLDSKVKEADIASLNRQMKIEELEAQLQEAEDIVKDLREELEQVQSELEKVTNNQVQSLEDPNLRINISGPMLSPTPDSQPELVRSSDMKKYIFNEKYDSQVDRCQCHIHNSGFASIVVRSEEPELYRNGCSQRIRACERDLLDEKLSLSGQIDDMKSEKASRLEEDTVKVDECGVEKSSDILKAIREYEEDSVLSWPVTSLRWKRKRANRYNKERKAPSFRCTPHLSCSKTTPYSVCNSHNETEIEAQKDPKHSKDLDLKSETPETVTQLKHVEASKNEMTVKPESARQEIVCAEKSEVLCSKIDVVEMNASACDLTEGLASQPADNRFLKYTFCRKRKRELLNSSVGLDNGILKKNTAEKQNGYVETQKSSLATVSS